MDIEQRIEALEQRRQENYDWATDLARRQRELNAERNEQQGELYEILVDLGRIATVGYDVT